MCLSVGMPCVGSFGGLKRLQDPLEVELEPPDVGAGNRTLVLWKSSKSHPSSPTFTILYQNLKAIQRGKEVTKESS